MRAPHQTRNARAEPNSNATECALRVKGQVRRNSVWSLILLRYPVLRFLRADPQFFRQRGLTKVSAVVQQRSSQAPRAALGLCRMKLMTGDGCQIYIRTQDINVFLYLYEYYEGLSYEFHNNQPRCNETCIFLVQTIIQRHFKTVHLRHTLCMQAICCKAHLPL